MEESVKSLKSFEEWEVKSTKRDIEEEEETLEREIVLLKNKLEKEERQLCLSFRRRLFVVDR